MKRVFFLIMIFAFAAGCDNASAATSASEHMAMLEKEIDELNDEIEKLSAGFETKINGLNVEISDLNGDIEWLEFRVKEEKGICEYEVNRLGDLNLNMAKKLQMCDL